MTKKKSDTPKTGTQKTAKIAHTSQVLQPVAEASPVPVAQKPAKAASRSASSTKAVAPEPAKAPAKTPQAEQVTKAGKTDGQTTTTTTAEASPPPTAMPPAPKKVAQKKVATAKVTPTVTPTGPIATPAATGVPQAAVSGSTVKADAPAKPAVPPKAATPAKPAAAATPEPDLSVTGVPVRSARPSSRLTQLTVPSIAQSVASNAVKAGFNRAESTSPILSPTPSALKKDSKLANNWKKKTVDQLTDAEIMAMSDDDYMNETQLAFFRLKLVRLQNDILSNAGETTEHLREDTVVVPDPTDRATIEEEHALELRTRDRERKLLKKIEQSIASIDTGNYGYCEATGEAIGVARLLARPTANLSLEAQQRHEIKQKMFGE